MHTINTQTQFPLPKDSDVQRVMRDLGITQLQAERHVQQRMMILQRGEEQRRSNYLAGL